MTISEGSIITEGLSNTVALCPNCHSRMHILDDENDIQVLKEAISAK